MAILNITYAGRSADAPFPVDGRLRDADIKRTAVEILQSGGIPGLHLPRLGARAFDHHVVDRFRGGKNERIYLRPKVPFG